MSTTSPTGFRYEGDAKEDDNTKAAYAVSLTEMANVGKKNVPYIIQFFDLQNKTYVPAFTYQSIVRYALFPGKSIENPPLFQLKGMFVYPGSQTETAIACISPDGSKLYRGTKAEGTPLLTVSGNRRNFWVEQFVWGKVLEKEIADFLKEHPEANKPFPAKQ